MILFAGSVVAVFKAKCVTICFYDMLWFTHCFSQEKYPFFVLGTYLHYVEKLNENVRISFLLLSQKITLKCCDKKVVGMIYVFLVTV